MATMSSLTRKPSRGSAGDAGDGEVLANNDRFKIVGAGQDGAGDILVPFALQHAEHLEVGGQPLDAGDTGSLDSFVARGCRRG